MIANRRICLKVPKDCTMETSTLDNLTSVIAWQPINKSCVLHNSFQTAKSLSLFARLTSVRIPTRDDQTLMSQYPTQQQVTTPEHRWQPLPTRPDRRYFSASATTRSHSMPPMPAEILQRVIWRSQSEVRCVNLSPFVSMWSNLYHEKPPFFAPLSNSWAQTTMCCC